MIQKTDNILLDSLTDGVCVIDRDCTIVEVNAQVGRWFADAERAVGKPCCELLFKQDHPCSSCPLQRSLETGARESEAVEIVTDAGLLPVECISYPLASGDGAMVILQQTGESLSHKEKLKRSTEQYRSLAEAAGAVLWEYDIASDNWSYVAPQVREILGYEPEDWTNLSFWADRIHPEDQGWATSYCADCTKRGEDHHFEYRFRKRDGTYAWLRDEVKVDVADGSPIKLRGFMIDITADMNAKEKIRRSADRYAAIIEILQHKTDDLQEFLDYALEKAVSLTGSTYGYILFYEEETKLFTMHAWSGMVYDACEVADPLGHFELDKTGIWGEAVRQNRPIIINDFQADNPLKRGVPEGHVELTRFLTIPIYYQEKIVAVAAVANRPYDYDTTDAMELTLLMEAIWKTVEAINSEESLRRIEWLLTSRPKGAEDRYESPYGDLTELNTDGLIKNSVGEQMLSDIVSDYLDLLDTSAAVYEKNGDYALGIFSSGWCRFMDASSRNLCHTDDNRTALDGGAWLCHESCWSDASLTAMGRDEPVDISCEGGINMFAVPIRAGSDVIGAINVGYGDPPKDMEKLRVLADTYQVSVEKLRELAENYESRPAFIIELAKRRVEASARLIGEIVERKRSEESLRTSEEYQKALIEASPLAILTIDLEGRVLSWNKAAEQVFGWSEHEVLGEIPPFITQSSRDEFYSLVGRSIQGEVFENIELLRQRKDGSEVSVVLNTSPIFSKDGELTAIISILSDVTVQKELEREQKQLEERLLQAHKLESVGRLAGGIAHDFNNMLGVILGYTEMAMNRLDAHQPLYADLKEVFSAAQRSAELTKQLLAYARKQPIKPQVLEVNRKVREMLKMLRRMIGEHIQVVWEPGDAAGAVRMDPSQVDQILVNLCVNAREAISGTGTITIETRTAEIDSEYAVNHPECAPGEYVVLSVSDDGCGMDAQLLSQVFEPFFTTKDFGEGTGLGLSTVFGIVKQNGGFINAYSEPGTGTTFRIYLPRYADEGEKVTGEKAAQPEAEDRGTILLVDDDPMVHRMAVLMVKQLGYTVLPASSPREALHIAAEHPEIDLLISDVIMPDMNGTELFSLLREQFTGLKCLFMSGYTASAAARNGVLEEESAFIQKPFSMRELALKIQELLPDNS